MGANLVRAPGQGAGFDHASCREALDHAEVGLGWLAVLLVSRRPLAPSHPAAQRGGNLQVVPGRLPFDECVVNFSDLMLAELM